MKKILLLILISNSLYGQTGKDTTRTYTHTELKKIAKKIARANYCDTMLNYANIQITQDSLKLISKDKEIYNFTKIGFQNDSIKLGLNNKIIEYKTKETKVKNKNNFLKIGWITTGVLVLLENIWIVIRSGI